jgi:hypothetical protein
MGAPLEKGPGAAAGAFLFFAVPVVRDVYGNRPGRFGDQIG